MSDLFNAGVLGVVEGLTEFLPVSSTGHLIVVTELMHKNQEALSSFNIIIQFGAIMAVVVLFFERFKDLYSVEHLTQLKATFELQRLNLFHVAFAILPVLSIGFFTRKWIKSHLYNPSVVAGATILVAIIMILVERKKRDPQILSLDKINYKHAFTIGLGQVCALVPGVSRSGATILTSLLIGLDLKTAADFSFLISVPVITIATVYELLKSYRDFHSADFLPLIVGLVVSFLVAVFAIKTFLKILKKLGLTPFAYYRILFGIIYFIILHF